MADRKNKSKPEVIRDIQQTQDFKKRAENSERLRTVLRYTIYPFLLGLNDSIWFTKVFMQVCASSVDSIYRERQKVTKVADLLPRLNELYINRSKEDKEKHEKFREFFELMKDETVEDFINVVQNFPKFVEEYFTHEAGLKPILDLPIDKIMGGEKPHEPIDKKLSS